VYRGRLEDRELLRGRARFLADLDLPSGTLHAQFVRSDVASGQILSLDLAGVRAAPGVVAAYDAQGLGVAPYHHFPTLPAMTQEPLIGDRVRHVGEAVALIVAETREAGVDAADHVGLEIEPDRPVVDPRLALGAPPIHASVGTNLVAELDLEWGPPHPLEDADRVFELTVINQRVASSPLECDGILVIPEQDRLDVWCTAQGVHPMRRELARGLDIDPENIRLRCAAVGGGFGGRGSLLVEYLAVAAAARRLARPVLWVGSRFENLTGMSQGRGHTTVIRLGVDRDGRPTGLDCDAVVDAGSVAHMNALLMISAARQAVGLYRIPALHWRGRAVLTNTTPVGAYRGAGQPEANHARERLIDIVAQGLGRDPIEYRLEHLLADDELPADQPGGVSYDSGRPRLALEMAVERAAVDRWREVQGQRVASGDPRRIGIGVACYAQTSGRGEPADNAMVRVAGDGSVDVYCGSASHGQAHRTVLAGIVSDRLGVAAEDVRVTDADTDAVPDGLSTGGSRASQVLASVVAGTCDDVLDLARRLAARVLEADERDLVAAPAGYGRSAGLAVAGVPTRRVGWPELARLAETELVGQEDAAPGCLEAARAESVAGASHPYGAYVTVVEVDTETGAAQLLAHTSVDDCGVALAPALVAGQQHGGTVAGLSQVFWEHAGHDEDGNPTGSSFLGYLLPAASELCGIDVANVATRTERNPLGTRGIGENGCNGAIASGHNAVLDALADLGVEHLDLPLTPEKIWRAVHEQVRPTMGEPNASRALE